MYPTRLIATLIASIYVYLCPALYGQNGEIAPRIVFLGDSLTAGYGLSPEEAYPALITQKLKNASLPYEVVAAGLSGETSAGGLRRVNWILQKPASILVIALGSNDGLRGIDPADTRKNLQGIIDAARSKHPNIRIVLAGMQMPPNLGEAYTSAFQSIFPEIAESSGVALIPFLLEEVGGNPQLNIEDGIHPNAEGHKILAATVWQTLEPMLREKTLTD